MPHDPEHIPDSPITSRVTKSGRSRPLRSFAGKPTLDPLRGGHRKGAGDVVSVEVCHDGGGPGKAVVTDRPDFPDGLSCAGVKSPFSTTSGTRQRMT